MNKYISDLLSQYFYKKLSYCRGTAQRTVSKFVLCFTGYGS